MVYVTPSIVTTSPTVAFATAGKAVTVNNVDKVQFEIKKGTVDRKEGLTFALHVGADADMTNKISVQIDALDTKGLGINGLNVAEVFVAPTLLASPSSC